MYTLDTNSIIYYLKGDKRAISIIEDIFTKDVPIFISAITEIELFSFPKLSQKEISQLNDFIQIIAVVRLDSRIAQIAGLLRRNFALKLPDSAIADTALFTGSTLVSRNTQDFKSIPQLNILGI